MITPKKVAFITLLAFYLQAIYSEQTHFVFMTASYNNEQWCEKNLLSAFNQNYDNWRMIYVNDCSTDTTAQCAKNCITEHNMWDKVTFIDNQERMGHLYNQYHAIASCKPEEVVVILDGDDWIAHNNVLLYLDNIYSQQDVWLTYGQFWYFHKNHLGCSRKLPDDIIKNRTIRKHPVWVTSHLRTFRAGLFQSIDLESLLYRDSFFPMCADGAAMIPMIEMAGEKIRFIPDVLYIYNDNNPLNFYHDKKEKQKELWNEIRSRPQYPRLESTPF